MIYSLYKPNNETIHIRIKELIYRHKNYSVTDVLDYEKENYLQDFGTLYNKLLHGVVLYQYLFDDHTLVLPFIVQTKFCPVSAYYKYMSL